ncbi:nuclear transcription factor Y subunit B-1-like [Diospyros lotus]|uniref:nuclear transcription factor Y subunit B-1-like n=1 Tax=Diospyros lotus TaxID=55363 RepID=UPI00224D6168|nr:nuclear transcription factor Y subunit B-1-like [Diospyros lotus]XP_052204884.1 nuclear transcription factor Y subunit B-1-like [Diospyros lotus]XP_052204886.1 nuclear transcription factor Y subunit B-1-like [Diospyros lotus]
MADAPASPPGGSHESGGGGDDHSPHFNVREQDRYLPIANISRIMKKALPSNGKIAKDAKDTVQECVSEFISFITSEASDKCQKEKRKTINGDDLLWAMATLGFEDYIDPLKVYLTRYREFLSSTFAGLFCGLIVLSQLEGDTKGSTRGGDGSSKEVVGAQLPPNAQFAHQASFTQGMNYLNSQI